ncbi:hypothetical protein NITGR_200013 [Nitrospina gracilis 3/211]|uniref:Uncharacterized protein n=1 Tax=Nitrospina gracilis (strain 3/211) TaxID=1266370 RepID=M1YWJ2_NITG3|nr:hypothetical protein NITGR_200013 [Nitrospina gracilis 3/211]
MAIAFCIGRSPRPQVIAVTIGQ